MRVTFLAKELVDLGILTKSTDFDVLPEIGDFVTITDFLEEPEKELFVNHIQSLNKIEMATVNGRIWSKIDGKNIIELSLHFENAE